MAQGRPHCGPFRSAWFGIARSSTLNHLHVVTDPYRHLLACISARRTCWERHAAGARATLVFFLAQQLGTQHDNLVTVQLESADIVMSLCVYYGTAQVLHSALPDSAHPSADQVASAIIYNVVALCSYTAL
jgi:hypothetical protein